MVNVLPDGDTGQRRTRAERSGESRQRVIEAAARCVAEEGFQRTNLALVAKRAGLSIGAIQHHFGDKTSVLTAVVERGFERLRERGDPFQRPRSVGQPTVALDDRTQLALVPAAAEEDAFCRVNYVEVRCTGTLTVLAYEIELNRPLEKVAHVVDPRSWPSASPASAR